MSALIAKSMTYATGAVPAFVAATAAGDTVEAPGTIGTLFLCYRNTNAGTRTVTIASPGTNSYGQPDPTSPYTLPAAAAGIPGELWIPLHPRQQSGGQIAVTLSTDVGVTVVPVKIA